MANNYGIFFSTCSINKKCPSVSLLGLLAATASFRIFTEANVWKTLPNTQSRPCSRRSLASIPVVNLVYSGPSHS